MERKNLSDTLAEDLREAVLAGAWKPGQPLPTEPELAEMYGVSRAVVRDATRIVMAWGLVEPRQGKGVYVTEKAHSGFAEALLLALRRTGGSAWDVEQIERLLLPEAAAMAAARKDQVDIPRLYFLVDEYRRSLDAANAAGKSGDFDLITRTALGAFMEAFYEASGNALMSVLGPAVARIRKPRQFEDLPGSYTVVDTEKEILVFRSLVEAVEKGNPEEARSTVAWAIHMPLSLAESLKKTPAGKVPRIPVTLETFYALRDEEDGKGRKD